MSQHTELHSFNTRAVREGQYQDFSDVHSEGLALTASYVFDDAEDAAEKFAGRRPGNVYVRFGNPTTRAFEQRMAALEDAESAVALASGMAAYTGIALGLLRAGDHVVLAEGIFGTTTTLFSSYMRKFGVSSSVVDVTSLERWQEAIRPNTRLFVVESPTNPLMRVADIRQLSELASAHDILLVVDNTLCTPVYQNPLALGADLVVHSTAKYIDGQGRAGGGVVVGPAELTKPVSDVLRTAGPSPSPFNSWVFLKSLETLPVRMREHSANAQVIAEWLEGHPAVERVYFCGLKSHPQRDLIDSQQTGPGGLISFTVAGGQRDAWGVIDRLELISNTTNIGDTKTMITHPASTTHGRVSPVDKERAGITSNLLRVSTGLEDVGDLMDDLDQALRGVTGGRSR